MIQLGLKDVLNNASDMCNKVLYSSLKGVFFCSSLKGVFLFLIDGS